MFIPTAQTAVRKIKQTARRIQKERSIPFSAALDESARLSGYTDYHHVTQCLTPPPTLRFGLYPTPFGPRQGDFYPGPGIEAATEQLDRLLEELGDLGFSDPFFSELTEKDLARLIRLCRRLVCKYPQFLDGHAHLLGALCINGTLGEELKNAQTAFDHAVALIPDYPDLVISYFGVNNRPFYRLAHNLLYCYETLGRDAPPSLSMVNRYKGDRS